MITVRLTHLLLMVLLALFGGSVVVSSQAAVLSAGDIIVVDSGARSVIKVDPVTGIIGIDPNTGAQTAISSGGFFVNPLAVALGAAGELMVADEVLRLVREPSSRWTP